MPEIYERCLGPALFGPFAVHLAESARRLGPASVLELAAGTGIATAELSRAVPTARITATDLNPAMVSRGARNIPAADWRVADAQHLDLASAAFDLVACQFGVMFFPDRPAAFAEAARVLAPTGTLLFNVWDELAASRFPAEVVASLAVVLPEGAPDFIGRVPHGYADPDRIANDLRSGGLEPDRIERVVLRGRADSARTLAQGFCLGTPLRFALEQRGPLDELTDAVAAELTARLGSGPVEGELVAFEITAGHRGER